MSGRIPEGEILTGRSLILMRSCRLEGIAVVCQFGLAGLFRPVDGDDVEPGRQFEQPPLLQPDQGRSREPFLFCAGDCVLRLAATQ